MAILLAAIAAVLLGTSDFFAARCSGRWPGCR
jgi:hypothetical protein